MAKYQKRVIPRSREPVIPKPRDDETAPASPTLVVGIGASAGGLGPIRTLLPLLKPNCGLTVIIVQHLGPGGDAMLASLVQEKTPFTVVEATADLPLLADHIYIVPARGRMSVIKDRFSHHDEAHCRDLRMPIDHFLCALAADRGRRCVGIILSGTGRDGMHGLAEVKAVGGATLVQDPTTAEFPEMPASSIAAGNADAVLAPEKMGAFLTHYLAETHRQTAEQIEEAGLEAVLAAVRNAIGHDFHCYKRPTLARRTRRRMSLHQLDNYDDYARMIRTNKDEAAALRKDLLIGVTEFFRQPEAWSILEEKVIPELIDKAPPGSTLRVWVPACSIGKEAYSLALLMVENIERSGKQLALQVFATDADPSAVDIARSGIYAEDDLKGLSQPQIERFCVSRNGRYEFIKELRNVMVFAPQDLTADPPFSKLDLVSCRNLMIYLDQTVQKKIIQLFHFALRDGGSLFLGSAETTCGQDNLFAPISQKWRIYRKLGVTTPVGLELPLRPQTKPAVSMPAAVPRSRLTLPSIAQQALAERYAPAAAVVDRKGALLYTHGSVGTFLEVPAGETTGLLADAAREGLRNRLTGALVQAVSENKKIVVQARVRKDKKSIPVKITVSPIRHPREADGLLLVTFEALKPPRSAPVATEGGPLQSDTRQLEDELKITREELSSSIEQFALSNEHLKAANEEATAANEELQSANEEMETSKEELQSLNEELNAVNLRLQEKVLELEQASNDVSNLLTSGSIATVFLDKDLKVRRFTHAITNLLGLVETDIGRPITDIHRKFHDDALLSDSRRVLKNLIPASAEVQAEDGKWYDRRILPYRTKDDRIEGIVITFNDISELKELTDVLRCSEISVRQSESRYRELVQNANSAIIRWKRDGRITFFNEYAQSFFGYSAEEVIGKPVGLLLPPTDSAGGDLSALTLDIVTNPEKYLNNVNENICRDGRRVWMAWTNKPILDDSGEVSEILAIGMDVTEHKRAEAVREQLAAIVESSDDAILSKDLAGTILSWNYGAERLFGYRAEEVIGRSISLLVPPDRQAEEDMIRKRLRKGDRVEHLETVRLTKDQRQIEVLVTSSPLRDAQGRVIGASKIVHDITERKRAEEALRASEQRYRMLFDSMQEGFYLSQVIFDNDGKPCDILYLDANPAFERIMGLRRDQIVGHRGKELVPTLNPGWLETFGRVQLTGEPTQYDSYSEQFKTHFEAFVFRPAPNQFAVLVTDITKRKRTEEALRLSEEKFALAFASNTAAIALTRLSDGRFMEVNDTWLAMNGYRREEIIGRFANALPIWPTGEARSRFVQELLDKGAIRGWEQEFVRKSGEIYVAQLSAQVLTVQGEQMVLSTLIDITERKRAEESLRKSEDRLRLALEASELGTWDLDLITGIPTHSLRHDQIFGFEEAQPEWSLDIALQHVLPEDRQKVREAHVRADKPDGMSVEARVRWPDGSLHWINSRGRFHYDSNGRAVRIVGVVADITERKRAEEALLKRAEDALRMSEQEFQSLAESMPQIVWATRPDGWNIYFNQQWVDYTGMTMEASHGHGWNAPFHPDDKQRAWEAWQRATQYNEPYSLECRLRRADGVYRWFLIRGAPMLGANGEILKWFGTCTDIEEIKQAEAALKTANDQLEQRVAERTAALRESHNRFNVLIQNVDAGVALIDDQGKFAIVNQAFLRLFDLPSESSIKNVNDRDWGQWQVIEEDGKLVDVDEHPVRKAALTGKVVRNRLVAVRSPSHESLKWMLISADPILKPSGQIEALICTYHDITDLKRAQEAVQSSLREKEVLLKEIHHRVKNNMQVISSLVSLHTDKLENPALRGVFDDLRNQVRAMALVHDKLYQSESLASIDFAEYARSLLVSLWRAYGETAAKVRFTLDIPPVAFSIETAVPCGLILNELVTNALKHAFPDRTDGHLTVALNATEPDGTLCLRVSDNGIGFPPGLDWRQTPSLGLHLVQLLIGQLGGTANVRHQDGTEFQITFKPE